MTTPADPSPAPPPRRGAPWMVLLPSLLLIGVAAAWSAFWFVAADKANDAVEVWLAREARAGRVYACADKSWSGYPFRIELNCDGATARLPGDAGPVVATAPRLVVVTQVYDPRRLIGDLTGPVEITDAAGAKTNLTFAVAQGSVAIGDRRFERGSIALTAPRLVVDRTEIGAVQKLDLHLRRRSDVAEGTWDLAARLDAGVSPFLDLVPAGSGPASLELQLEARGLDDLRPQPAADRLKAFAEAGGQVHVALARAVRGEVAVEARGDLALDVDGRLDGALKVTARGVDDLVASLVGASPRGKKDVLSSLLGVGAQMLGKPERLDERPATAYRVKIDRGRVDIGPLRVFVIPPLF